RTPTLSLHDALPISVDGLDVVSTIDVNIQDIAHHELLAQLEKYKADHGSVVVMETRTGEIKAISNLGRTSKGTYYEKLNYAVGEDRKSTRLNSSHVK